MEMFQSIKRRFSITKNKDPVEHVHYSRLHGSGCIRILSIAYDIVSLLKLTDTSLYYAVNRPF